MKYDLEISPLVIKERLKLLINQVYKLLPMREEGTDWEKPLFTIMEELSGMSRLLENQQQNFFVLLSKMEGLFTLTNQNDFFLYRRTIFECLGLLNLIFKNV